MSLIHQALELKRTCKIRYSRPNAANREPYMCMWIAIDFEKNISVMYAQHSKNIEDPEWERINHIDGDFSKRVLEEYLSDDMVLEAWYKLRKE